MTKRPAPLDCFRDLATGQLAPLHRVLESPIWFLSLGGDGVVSLGDDGYQLTVTNATPGNTTPPIILPWPTLLSYYEVIGLWRVADSTADNEGKRGWRAPAVPGYTAHLGALVLTRAIFVQLHHGKPIASLTPKAIGETLQRVGGPATAQGLPWLAEEGVVGALLALPRTPGGIHLQDYLPLL